MKASILNNRTSIDKKPDNSIELQLKSDKNISYNISIYYEESKLYFIAISKDDIRNKKKYENSYSIDEVKKNNYFNLFQKIEDNYDVYDVYKELENFIKQQDINKITLLEKANRLIIIFSFDSFQKSQFELGENGKQKFENILQKLNELEEKAKKKTEENYLLKRQINKLIEENKNLKEQIIKAEIKIQSGEYFFDFWNIDSHYMYTKFGNRSVIEHIKFEENYEKTPNVMATLNGLDAGNDANVRIKVYAENIDTSGFDLRVDTWDNTSIFRVKASWISYG